MFQHLALLGMLDLLAVLTANNDINYNFFAAGDAPNYFDGGVQFDTAAGTTALNDYEEGDFVPAFVKMLYNSWQSYL